MPGKTKVLAFDNNFLCGNLADKKNPQFQIAYCYCILPTQEFSDAQSQGDVYRWHAGDIINSYVWTNAGGNFKMVNFNNGAGLTLMSATQIMSQAVAVSAVLLALIM